MSASAGFVVARATRNGPQFYSSETGQWNMRAMQTYTEAGAKNVISPSFMTADDLAATEHHSAPHVAGLVLQGDGWVLP